MPDYEIRFFRNDGSLAVIHMSIHVSDEDAHTHARGLIAD